MEFLSGYAAARAPLSAYQVEPPPPSTSSAAASSSGQQRSSSHRRAPRPLHPTRSNSTSGTHSHRKRRQHGHARLNSASTTGSSGAPLVSSAAGPGQHHHQHHQSSSHHGHGHKHKLLTPAWLQPQPPLDYSHDAAATAANSASSGASAGPGPRATSSLDHYRFLSPPSSSHHHPERISTFGRYPNIHNTHDSKYLTPPNTGSASEPSSARSPIFSQGGHHRDRTDPLAPTTSNLSLVGGGAGASIAFAAHAASSILERSRHVPPPQSQGQQHASSAAGAIMPLSSGTSSKISGYDGSRAESVSSIAGTTISSRTFLSSDPLPNPDQLANNQARPFVVRNGRTYISDPTLAYPLPVDLEEIHRQTLRTLLLLQLFGKPICSPEFADQPPKRILEIGCGSAVWSMLCYKHYKNLGQADGISFTGIDIAPLAPPSSSGNTDGSDGRRSNRASSSSATLSAAGGGGATSSSGMHPDPSMNWRFVQHDCRKFPFPFADASFDLIMCKDVSLITTTTMQQPLIDEYIRLLAPGGAVEIWESDHTLRMLRPHVPEHLQNSSASAPAAGGEDGQPLEGTENSEAEKSPEELEAAEAARLGAYVMTPNTPLSSPLNHFLVEYNAWLSKALEARSLSSMPCTLVGPIMLQEAETLTGMGNKRLAVPLSEVRWEREGVGGVVTKDGKAFISTKPSLSNLQGTENGGGKTLGPEARALRRTALTTVVQMIQSLEHILRDVSGKSQDEWDAWMGKMMNDLVRENGTSWGECLEVGAWWAKRR
ncbi:hypothetical protein B0H65DRAFT_419041 [Neurospora tetraspora]|uniref:Methyltransferase type 11 domain-containing protein n=1 Tax=Neurospora tetraspora TaxID=94610 RepID=A0AAE0JJI9_9PEZI|nr:hypothetical protein B0H65DRAFT_419041 [Neurospora tetraspora]